MYCIFIGEFPVPYIDALFLTYSSMTVTGLSTVNLSTTTPFQQSVLFVLMLLGDVVCNVFDFEHVRSWLKLLSPDYGGACDGSRAEMVREF